MSAAVSGLLTYLMGGSAMAALAKVVLAVAALVIGLLYWRYLGILGADRRRPVERQAYDARRNTLARGNMATRLHAERLTRFLDQIDRFFGDAGMADRTLFPHAFGLRKPTPLWTAPAFNRCLVLAFVYPIGSIFLIWAVSGHVGRAEAALGLPPVLVGWQRATAARHCSLCALPIWCEPGCSNADLLPKSESPHHIRSPVLMLKTNSFSPMADFPGQPCVAGRTGRPRRPSAIASTYLAKAFGGLAG
jgi:hypothetical protein